MPATIAGIATALPPHRVTQAAAAASAKAFCCESPEQERLLELIFEKSGVEGRNLAVLEATSGDLEARQSFYGPTNPTTRDRMQRYEALAGGLARQAAAGALADAGIDPERVTHLVTVSCTGFFAPGVDSLLIRSLGLRADVARTHVGFMGCHALLNGMRVARAIVEAESSACVLLCAVELCSLHFQYGWDVSQIVVNALFADGAAAMVILPESTRPSRRIFSIAANGSTILPDCDDAMSWRIGDHGFTMTLSQRVPELIAGRIGPWLTDWAARQGLAIDSVGSWAVHPGGPRILAAFSEAAGLDRSMLEPSYRTLVEHGNMSSTTIAFILERLRARQAPRPCVAIAFGPGLAVEAALLG